MNYIISESCLWQGRFLHDPEVLCLAGFEVLGMPTGDALICSVRASSIQTPMEFENYNMTNLNHYLSLFRLFSLYYNSGTTEVFQGPLI